MKRWSILINGTNFRIPFQLPRSRRKHFYHAVFGDESRPDQKIRRMGFYTWVFVTARSPAEAELKAVDVLRADKSLRSAVRNTKNDPPRLFADEIRQIRSFRGCHRPRMGLLFYAEHGPKRRK
jgi:hypothetical protein